MTYFFSQKNTDEQNTQTFTETLSQPITQSVTANVSWKASVNSVCRRPSVGSKRAPKSSVRSVSSVREKTFHEWISVLKTSVTSVFSVREKSPQRVTCVSSHSEGAFYFSQIYTEEQNTQSFTETLSQPISQSVTANTHHPTPFLANHQHLTPITQHPTEVLRPTDSTEPYR